MKPAETGVANPQAPRYSADAARLAAAAGVEDPPDLVVPYRLREPLAPAVAAELEGRKISAELVFSAYAELSRRHEFLIVEGAGGIAVPFNEDLDMAGLALALDLPLLVVSPTRLGVINQCVLTVEYARTRNLKVLGILLNLRQKLPNIAERTNLPVISRLTSLPTYGPLDLLASVEGSKPPGIPAAVEAIRHTCPELVEALVEPAPAQYPREDGKKEEPGRWVGGGKGVRGAGPACG
jgi:dethiobiotin synthetase